MTDIEQIDDITSVNGIKNNVLNVTFSCFKNIIGEDYLIFRKPVYLEAYNETVIRHVVIDTEKVGTNWKVNVDVYFQNNRRNQISGVLNLNAQANTAIWYTLNLSPNSYGETVASTSFLVSEVSISRQSYRYYLRDIKPRIVFTFWSVSL